MTNAKHICLLRPWVRIIAACTPILSLLAGAGCRVGPNYKKPAVKVPSKFESTSPNIKAGVSGDLSTWWTNLNDPTLNALVRQVMQGNLDIKIAGDRIAQAQAIRGIVSGADQPHLDADASATRESYSLNSVFGPFLPERRVSDYIAGFNARWELDLFGKTARSIEAAQAGIDAAQENRRAVMVAMSAGVAKQYILVRQLQRQIEVANDNIRIQRNTLDVVQHRLKAGLVNELVVQQAKAQLEVTQAVLPKLDTELKQAIHRIGILTGQEPKALETQLTTGGEIPATKPMVPVGLPSELLTRRPDIRVAERNLAAATANIGVATADLFPRFSLTGSLGQESVNVDTISGGASRFWTLASGLSWPVLDAGIIRANIRLQNARQRQAYNLYVKSVLNALEEVEDALVAYGNEQQRTKRLEAGTEANRKSVELATQRYQKGLVDFLNVLDAERQLYQSQDALAVSRGRLALNLIALYESLGGGWQK
jgi:outer membrane protein, multidrug efflux system